MKNISGIILLLSFIVYLVGCTHPPIPPIDENPDLPVYNPTPYKLIIPEGLPRAVVPASNPLTEEGIQLGRMLFYDTILSKDLTMSCASCHNIDFGFTDNGKRFSTGVNGLDGNRTSMPLFNLIFQDRFFWDGRAFSLEEQVLMPIPDHLELAKELSDLITDLRNHPLYPLMFYKAFGTTKPTPDLVAKALAQFLRIIISGSESRFHKYEFRDEGFLTPSEKNGFDLFNALWGGDCLHCHGMGNGLLGDFKFRNNGLNAAATIHDFPDPGLGGITGDPKHYGLFKTPSLINIALTAPYMHDGRFATLEEVIEHYSTGLKHSPNINPAELEFVNQGGVNLSAQQKTDIVNFLKTLTDTTFLSRPELQNPFR